MGKRSRKRQESGTDPFLARTAAPPPPAAPRRTPGAPAGRPQAPWHPFPLVELSALIGLVLLVYGFVTSNIPLIAAGMALGSLAGLDTTLREHFSGFKSHSTLIAGLPTVVVAGSLYFLEVLWPILVAAAVLTFAAAFVSARNAFRRKAGVAFR